MIFECGEVYSAENGNLIPYQPLFTPIKYGETAIHSMKVKGLHRNDIALFGHHLTDDGGWLESYFVTKFSAFETATLVNTDLVVENPSKYMTRRLEKLLLSVGEDELAQFSIDSVIKHVFNKERR